MTEYGLVNLYGKNMSQRAQLLIGNAQPDHKETLGKAYHEGLGSTINGIYVSQSYPVSQL